jgi:hypothetical protein
MLSFAVEFAVAAVMLVLVVVVICNITRTIAYIKIGLIKYSVSSVSAC